jgi:mono/diheme cytochrome c family protein
MAFDLIMALDPIWYSSLFGGHFFISTFYLGLAGLAVVTGLVCLCVDSHAISSAQLSDLGKLMFGFCLTYLAMLWSQYVVIWYGNLLEETHFVVTRLWEKPWAPLSWGALIASSFLPFLFFLSRRAKQRPLVIFWLGILILVGLWVERYVLVVPSLWHGEVAPFGWIEMGVTAGFFGAIGLSYLVFLKNFPILPFMPGNNTAQEENREYDSNGGASLTPHKARSISPRPAGQSQPAVTGLCVLATIFLIFVGQIDAGMAQEKPKGDPQKGEQLYRALCWTCHGRYGRGDGPAARYLAAPPPDFTDPGILAGKSRETLFSMLSGKGGPGGSHRPMAIGQILKEDSLWDAIAYLRTLAVPGKHISIQAGRDIYNTFCWSCHGIYGDGKGPTAKNLEGVQPQDFRRPDFVIEGREEEVYRTIFAGAAKAFHGSPHMPEWKSALSRQHILDVMEYLKTFKKPIEFPK